jgi:hypothetical protein
LLAWYFAQKDLLSWLQGQFRRWLQGQAALQQAYCEVAGPFVKAIDANTSSLSLARALVAAAYRETQKWTFLGQSKRCQAVVSVNFVKHVDTVGRVALAVHHDD